MCNFNWTTKLTKVINEHTGCPKCSYECRADRKRLTLSEIEHRLIGRNITLTDKYINSHTPTDWTCNLCAHTWTALPTKILNQYTGCPHCADVGGGKFGRKCVVNGVKFDSMLEYHCYLELCKLTPCVVLQQPYPYNKRMKCDFVIKSGTVWIEVSSLKMRSYLDRIHTKRNMIESCGFVFVFATSPTDLINQLHLLV